MTGRNYVKFCKTKWCFSSHNDFFKTMKRTVYKRELLFKIFTNKEVLKRLTWAMKTVKCELMKCDTKLRLVLMWRIVKNPIKE